VVWALNQPPKKDGNVKLGPQKQKKDGNVKLGPQKHRVLKRKDAPPPWGSQIDTVRRRTRAVLDSIRMLGCLPPLSGTHTNRECEKPYDRPNETFRLRSPKQLLRKEIYLWILTANGSFLCCRRNNQINGGRTTHRHIARGCPARSGGECMLDAENVLWVNLDSSFSFNRKDGLVLANYNKKYTEAVCAMAKDGAYRPMLAIESHFQSSLGGTRTKLCLLFKNCSVNNADNMDGELGETLPKEQEIPCAINSLGNEDEEMDENPLFSDDEGEDDHESGFSSPNEDGTDTGTDTSESEDEILVEAGAPAGTRTMGLAILVRERGLLNLVQSFLGPAPVPGSGGGNNLFPFYFNLSHSRANDSVLFISIDREVEAVRRKIRLFYDGDIPFLRAVWANDLSSVKLLLLWGGVDVMMRDVDSGGTALHKAAFYTNNPELIHALVDAGADVNARDKTGSSPLMCAASRNNNHCLQALLSRGCSIAIIREVLAYENTVEVASLCSEAMDREVVDYD
jgi:hypothetical protein